MCYQLLRSSMAEWQLKNTCLLILLLFLVLHYTKEIVLWLGEQGNSPGSKEQTPRLILYIEDKGIDDTFNLMPDTDDTFKPSGAVTDIYSGISSFPSDKISQHKMNSVSKGTTEPGVKFCYECGSKLKINSKFCRNCGTKQE